MYSNTSALGEQANEVAAGKIGLRPCSIQEARAFVGTHHRHSLPPTSGLFAVAVEQNGQIVGVGIAGRPVSRVLADGLTVEITRIATTGAKNACSMIYGALCRAGKALGYERAITYTLESESGTSLRASGWVVDGRSPGGRTWHTPGRPRRETDLFGKPLTPTEAKTRWVRYLGVGK